MKRKAVIAGFAALATGALLLTQVVAAAAQGEEGALARALFIEVPKDTAPPAPPAEGQGPKQEGPSEAQPQPDGDKPVTAAEPSKPAESAPPATEQPPAVQTPQADAVPADPKQAAEKQRAANEADAAQDEAASAAKAPKRFIPTQKSQADSSATFPVDI